MLAFLCTVVLHVCDSANQFSLCMDMRMYVHLIHMCSNVRCLLTCFSTGDPMLLLFYWFCYILSVIGASGSLFLHVVLANVCRLLLRKSKTVNIIPPQTSMKHERNSCSQKNYCMVLSLVICEVLHLHGLWLSCVIWWSNKILVAL